MRMRSLVGIFVASLLVLATGGPAALAQYDSGGVVRPPPPPGYGSQRYQERVAPSQEARPRYVPGPQYGGPYQASPGYEKYRAQPQYGGRYRPAPPPSNNYFFPWLRP